MCMWWAGAQCAGGIRLAGWARIVRGPWVSVRSQQRLDDVVSVLLRSEHQGRVAVLRGGRVCVHMAMPMMLPCVCVVLVHRAGAALLAWRRRTKFLASRSAPTFRRRLTFATSPWPAARSSAVYPLASRLCVGSKAGVADQPEHTCQLAGAANWRMCSGWPITGLVFHMLSRCSTHEPWPMSRKTPLLSPRSAASTRAVESGSVSLNSPEDCMSVEPVRFHDIAAYRVSLTVRFAIDQSLAGRNDAER